MKRIKELRENKGMSQQALADKLNLSQQSIYKYENGLAEPSISTLKELAHFFNTSIDYIVEFNDNDQFLTYEKSKEIDFSSNKIERLKRYSKLDSNTQELFDKLIKKINEK